MSVTSVIDALTQEIKAGCFRLRLLTRSANHVTAIEYHHLARGMAFLALAQHYDADNLPDEVPPQVVREGIKMLSDELSGRGSDYYDTRMRNESPISVERRKDLHGFLTERWTLYKTAFGSSFREEPEWWSERMCEILRTKLPSKQWALLEAVYLHQTPRHELATQLIAQEPETYNTTDALRRATAALDTRISRARVAARTLLGQEYATRAREITAA